MMRPTALSSVTLTAILLLCSANKGSTRTSIGGVRLKRLRGVAVFVSTFLLVVAEVLAASPQWRPTGPYGGSIHVLTVDPVSPQRLYAGGSYGVYRSDNAGARWQPVFAGAFAPRLSESVRAMAIDPSNHDVVYVGAENDLVKSTDGGLTSTNILPGAQVTSLVVAGGKLYVGRRVGGLVTSLDGGATFVPTNTAQACYALASDPRSSSTIYAATERGVMKSTDSGSTWTNVLSNTDIAFLAIDRRSVVYAGSGSSVTPGQRLFKSADGGAHWDALDGPLTSRDFISALIVDPNDDSVLFSFSSSGVYRSQQNGTWGLIATPEVYLLRPSALGVGGGDGQTLYVGSELGGVVYLERPSFVWKSANDGITELTVTAMAVDPSNAAILYVGTPDGGLFKSVDAAASWQPMKTFLIPPFGVNVILLDPQNPSVLYVATSRANMIKSTDRGVTWRPLAALQAIFMPTVTALVLEPPSTLYAAGPFLNGAAVMRSNDGGMNWFHSSAGLPTGAVGTLAIDPAAPQTLYTNPTARGVYRTASGGSWTAINDGVTDSSIYSFAIAPGRPSTIYASARGVVFKSTGGVPWTSGRSGLPLAEPIGALTVDRTNPALVYAATSTRVYESIDGGVTWREMTATGLSTDVRTLAITSDHLLYAAGAGGVYQYLSAPPKRRAVRH